MNAIERTLDELPTTSADVLYEQACALRKGEGVRVNFRAAHRFFMLAALMGKRAAFYQLGMMNLHGEGRSVDKLRAAMWLKLGVGRDEPRAARNFEMVASDLTRAQVKAALALADEFPKTARCFGVALGDADADALVATGEAIGSGRGVDRDPEMASEWYRRALRFRHPRAQTMLGLAYLNGDGVERHREEALRLLKLAAAQGYADGQYELAQATHPQMALRTQAVALFEAAANQGHLRAQVRLGELYKAGEVGAASPASSSSGSRGSAPHLQHAFDWFGKAAAQSDTEALFEWGQMHAQGLGTKQDFEQAAACYVKAASQGHAKAAFNLAFLHAHGQGVEQDLAKAYQWYRVSELQGYALGRQSATLMMKKLSADEKELADWRADSFLAQIAPD
jgi:TPR repeat protein